MQPTIECVAPTRSKVGESPFWDAREQCLWWVDIPLGWVHRYDPATQENRSFDYGEPVGCLAVREKGGLVVAAKSGFAFFDPFSDKRTAISDPESHLPANRFNDGTTDRMGRLWAGTIAEGTDSARGSFYRLAPDLTVHRWHSGFKTTNGLAFSGRGDRMYFSDSHPSVRTIWASDYDPATGWPAPPSVFFDTREIPGRPDGGTVDADGHYWCAGVSGWQLYRISPEGKIVQEIDLPIEKPTKPMFGGPDLDVLYVTSIGSGLSDGTHQPDAGSLFEIKGLGARGLAQTPFAG